MNYNLSKEAREDLKNVYHYGVSNFGLEQANEYLNALLDLLDLITDQPEMFEKVKTRQGLYRRGLCGREVIFYRILANDTVRIIRIISRQDQMKVFG